MGVHRGVAVKKSSWAYMLGEEHRDFACVASYGGCASPSRRRVGGRGGRALGDVLHHQDGGEAVGPGGPQWRARCALAD